MHVMTPKSDKSRRGWRAGTAIAASALAMVAITAPPASSDVTARSAADGSLGSWSALGSGASGAVYSLARNSLGNLYAAGSFTTMGGVSANNIASWDGSTWSTLGTGVNAAINGMAISPDDTVYAGGNFTTAGGISATRVASWNGTAWSPLGSGLTDRARDFAFPSSGDVIAVGDFRTAGGQPALEVASWSGSAWVSMGTFATNGGMYRVIITEDDSIVIGGTFTDASSVPTADNIAAWSGSAWVAYGGGANATVSALANGSSGSVYAGGDFTTIGGVTASRIARFNGTTWSPLGNGLSGQVLDVLVDDTRGLVYASGYFDQVADGLRRIAVWDEGISTWLPLRTASTDGLPSTGFSLAFADDSQSSVIVGGNFTDAGGVSDADAIARWTWDPPTGANTLTASTGDVVTLTGWGLIGVPATGAVTFGGIPATSYTRDDSTTIRATVPSGVVGTVPVTVSAVGGTASLGTLTVPPPPPPAPIPATAPRDVTALAGDASASVSWDAPASTGSFPVSTYQVTSSPGGRTCLVAAPSLSCAVTGLTYGTAYTFTVRALTGAGWSSASEPSAAVTPRPEARPAAVITGSRAGDRISIAGETTGFGMGGTLRPWLRFPGQSAYSEGTATILVSMDGTFEWGRRTGKRVSVYVQTPDASVRSNVVTIR